MSEFDIFLLSVPQHYVVGVVVAFSVGFFYFSIYWLRGWLLSKRLLGVFPSGRQGSFFNVSVFDSLGTFHSPFDIGRYKLAIFSVFALTTNRPLWYLAVKQSLPVGVDAAEGIYRPSIGLRLTYAIDLYSPSQRDGKRIYPAESLPIKLKGLAPVDWEFAEFSGREVFHFYRLPELFGYGRMYEIAKWVRERNGSVNK